VEVPTGKTAGINPSKAFCSIVATVSNQFLEVIKAAPWIIPAALLGLATSVFVTVRNTEFSLAPEPLRRRRRFGQVLRGASYIYRRNSWLMLGIAFVFIPAGMIATGLQSLIFRNPPVEQMLSAFQLSRFGEIVLAIALGAAVFGIAYLVVVAGVVAAVADIEAGRPTSPMQAYRRAARNAGKLVRARARAIGIVFLLTISLVGIPWAVRRAVDWLFIEQAVLLDSASWREAAPQSKRAVAHDWWRTLAISALLAGIATLTSLIIVAPILLFATEVPLEALNLMSSLIYIALAPFVALSLTLLYFDISLQDGDAPADTDEARGMLAAPRR
jgi:hypothetical protein